MEVGSQPALQGLASLHEAPAVGVPLEVGEARDPATSQGDHDERSQGEAAPDRSDHHPPERDRDPVPGLRLRPEREHDRRHPCAQRDDQGARAQPPTRREPGIGREAPGPDAVQHAGERVRIPPQDRGATDAGSRAVPVVLDLPRLHEPPEPEQQHDPAHQDEHAPEEGQRRTLTMFLEPSPGQDLGALGQGLPGRPARARQQQPDAREQRPHPDGEAGVRDRHPGAQRAVVPSRHGKKASVRPQGSRATGSPSTRPSSRSTKRIRMRSSRVLKRSKRTCSPGARPSTRIPHRGATESGTAA